MVRLIRSSSVSAIMRVSQTSLCDDAFLRMHHSDRADCSADLIRRMDVAETFVSIRDERSAGDTAL